MGVGEGLGLLTGLRPLMTPERAQGVTWNRREALAPVTVAQDLIAQSFEGAEKAEDDRLWMEQAKAKNKVDADRDANIKAWAAAQAALDKQKFDAEWSQVMANPAAFLGTPTPAPDRLEQYRQILLKTYPGALGPEDLEARRRAEMDAQAEAALWAEKDRLAGIR